MSTSSHPLVWLITGCSSGFVSHIESLGGKWHTLDVCSSESVLRAKVKEAMNVWGRIDVLVNNAGYALLGAFESISDEEARLQMETNFFGPLTLTRLLVPHFRSRRSGQISSTTGIEARPSRSLYSASRFALEGLSDALYNEMKPFDVRVLLVEPGAFDSEFVDKVVKPEKGWEEVKGEYKGTEIERVMGMVEEMRGGNMRNCVEKGVMEIWDVVMNEGAAEGMEGFLRLPLGRDGAEWWEIVAEERRRTWEGTRVIWEGCERDEGEVEVVT